LARIHGRNATVYLAIASGAEASQVPFLASWSISASSEKAEVTAFGDANKSYVAGLPDSSGEFSGFLDDGTAQTYTAAVDGVARKMYLYVDRTQTSKYWYGTVFPDFSANASVGGATELSASWNAAGPINRSF
jgi:hypothetical protein